MGEGIRGQRSRRPTTMAVDHALVLHSLPPKTFLRQQLSLCTALWKRLISAPTLAPPPLGKPPPRTGWRPRGMSVSAWQGQQKPAWYYLPGCRPSLLMRRRTSASYFSPALSQAPGYFAPLPWPATSPRALCSWALWTQSTKSAWSVHSPTWTSGLKKGHQRNEAHRSLPAQS